MEETLTRIAVALETIVANIPVTGAEAVAKVPAKKKVAKRTPGARNPDGTRVTKVADGLKSSKEDFKDDAEKADARAAAGNGEPWCTVEELREHIRQYAQVFGGDKAIAKIIMYGAKKTKPLIAEVAKNKYKELVDDIMAELNARK